MGAQRRQGRARTRGSSSASIRSACSRPTTPTRCSRSTPTASATPRPPTCARPKRSPTWRASRRRARTSCRARSCRSCSRRTSSPRCARPLEDACATAGVSCFTSGIDPGWANDLLPLVLTGTCEYVDDAARDGDRQLRDLRAADGAVRHDGLRQAARRHAAAADPGRAVVRVGRHGEGARRRASASRSTSCARSTSAGPRPRRSTSASASSRRARPRRCASRCKASSTASRASSSSTSPASTTRSRPSGRSPSGHSGYRVIVTGNPSYTCDVQMMGDDGDHNTAGLVGTAGRIVNAIPAVCDAAGRACSRRSTSRWSPAKA